jgi:hypothetical protein
MSRVASRAQRVALQPYSRLCNLVRRNGRISLDGELELDPRQCMHLLVELGHLALGVAPDRVAHLEVLALDVKLHPASSDRPLSGLV